MKIRNGSWNARTGTRDGTHSGTRDPAERANRNALYVERAFVWGQGQLYTQTEPGTREPERANPERGTHPGTREPDHLRL